jgi:hypothetical protein
MKAGTKECCTGLHSLCKPVTLASCSLAQRTARNPACAVSVPRHASRLPAERHDEQHIFAILEVTWCNTSRATQSPCARARIHLSMLGRQTQYQGVLPAWTFSVARWVRSHLAHPWVSSGVTATRSDETRGLRTTAASPAARTVSGRPRQRSRRHRVPLLER